MTEIDALIADATAEHSVDPRIAVIEVAATRKGKKVTLEGVTTVPQAVDALIERIRALPDVPTVTNKVRTLPDDFGARSHAVVRSAIAPVYMRSDLRTGQISQYVLGHRVELLEVRNEWYRIRGEDAYIGWVHRGYLELAELEWAQAWERGADGEPMVSLGAELEDEAGRVFFRLPWGARIVADTPTRFRLPDGRRGTLSSGELVASDRLTDRFPARGESITRTARRWLGTPYQWGGVTPSAADCSGFVQSVYWMHGLALPRDSYHQARVGSEVEPDPDFEALRPGDLLFFTEPGAGRITHVTISLGGPHIIHSSISNGGVDLNDLTGDLPLEQLLRERLVTCRRILPDD